MPNREVSASSRRTEAHLTTSFARSPRKKWLNVLMIQKPETNLAHQRRKQGMHGTVAHKAELPFPKARCILLFMGGSFSSKRWIGLITVEVHKKNADGVQSCYTTGRFNTPQVMMDYLDRVMGIIYLSVTRSEACVTTRSAIGVASTPETVVAACIAVFIATLKAALVTT